MSGNGCHFWLHANRKVIILNWSMYVACAQKNTLIFPLILSQKVIYKRFHIVCPLEVFANHSVTTEHSGEMCTTTFFTVNQEVKLRLNKT